MMAFALAITYLSSMSGLAAAQEAAGDDLWEPSSFFSIPPPPASDPEPLVLPRSLSAEPLREDLPASFSVGPSAGYITARGADHGTWYGGVQARLHFARFLAAEAAITFHQNRYEDGDVVVTQYPLQLTAFLYIIPEGPIRPYILGGVGWYYTKIQYSGPFSAAEDKTKHIFGEHFGAGGELMLGPRLSANVDVRYIFLNATNDKVIDQDFNYWQITFGLNFFF